MSTLTIDRPGLNNVVQLADLFRQSAGSLIEELEEALGGGSFASREKLAHKLGGAAGNFGLERLCALLKELESGASTGVEPSEGSAKQLREEFDLALAALADHLSSQQASPGKLSASN